jgi:hypothetical protein
MTDVPDVCSANAAALFVGLSPSTLAKLRLSGNGPIYCKLGRRVVYRREDLEWWLESRIARDTSDADARLPKRLTGREDCRSRLPSRTHVPANKVAKTTASAVREAHNGR